MLRGLGGLSEESRLLTAIRGISKKSDKGSGWGRFSWKSIQKMDRK